MHRWEHVPGQLRAWILLKSLNTGCPWPRWWRRKARSLYVNADLPPVFIQMSITCSVEAGKKYLGHNVAPPEGAYARHKCLAARGRAQCSGTLRLC